MRRLAGLRGRLRAAAADPVVPTAPSGLLDVLRDGPVALQPGADPTAARLRIGVVIPGFRRGSGGHATIAHLVRALEARGHAVELFVDDPEGRLEGHDPDELFARFFGPLTGRVHLGFDAWQGADVALATGWQTVPRVLRLGATRARAYLVQDHEPEFYATSAERLWAGWTYRQPLHCICASPWLADLVRSRYGAGATAFDLAVDHDCYRPTANARAAGTVLVYARAVTARRAVPIALLAMQELHRRRPGVEIVLFGESRPIVTPFPHRALGVADARTLAQAYATATVGVCLSLTNPSLVPLEMLACGLPVVDVHSASMAATFGEDGPVVLSSPDPLSLCAAVERLLDDPDERARRAAAGPRAMGPRTWSSAAAQVEDGLRAALRAAHGG